MNTNGFKKSNFVLWSKIAVYASNSEQIHAIRGDKSYMSKKMTKLHNMSMDGYLVKSESCWNKQSFHFLPTQKFKDEFKEKFKELSKKFSPDFSDKMRERIFASYKF